MDTKILNLMTYIYTCMLFKTKGQATALIGMCIFMHSSKIGLILKEIRRPNTPNQIKFFHKIFTGNIYFSNSWLVKRQQLLLYEYCHSCIVVCLWEAQSSLVNWNTRHYLIFPRYGLRYRL